MGETEPQALADGIRRWRQALDLVESFRVSWRGTRFGRYIDTVELLHRIEQSSDRTAGLAGFQENDRNREMLFEGAGQMMQLMLASAVWHKLDSALLARKLKIVMAGPDLPQPRGQDDLPRDTLVELLAAALLADYGFEPSVTENAADVTLRGHGLDPVIVECKRPSAMGTALSKARRQLWRRTRHGKDLGVAVFAIECACDLPFRRWRARTEADADNFIDSRMEGVLNVVRRFDQVANGHYRLRRLAPVVFFVASGAILLDREDEGPVAIYYFSKVLPVASGPASDVPKGFADRLTEGASGPLLDEFRT